MKALTIILNNSVQFLWHDSEFASMLKRLSHSHAGDDRPSDNPENNAHHVEKLLSPLIVSSQILDCKFKEPISVINCEEAGCNIVFQQHDTEFYYIGFCENEQFAVYNVKKQLHVIREVVDFYLGPCKNNINPRKWIDKSRTWDKITKAVKSFIELHETEKSFLVGGVEKLHFTPNVQLNCSKTIQSSMDNLAKSLKKEKICYGILLVKNKVAGYETGTKVNQPLATGDIMKIIMTCNSKYKQVDIIDAMETLELSGSDDDYANISGARELSVKPLTRSITIPRRKVSMKPKTKVRFNLMEDDISSSLPKDGFFRDRGRVAASLPNLDVKEVRILHGHPICDSDDESDQEDQYQHVSHVRRIRRKSLPNFEFDDGCLASHEEIYTMPIFLKTADCVHAPFLMHTLNIADDVNFVLLTEMKHADIASIICNFIALLKKIKFKGDTSAAATKGSLTLEIEDGFRTHYKINECCNDLQYRLRNVSNDKQLRKIVSMWKVQISPPVQDYLEKNRKNLDKFRLERNITDLSSMLQTLFQHIFLMKSTRSKTNWREELIPMTVELKQRFEEHLEFYRAKASRNPSISWTYENYPGLLHFMLVRRLRRNTGVFTTGGSVILDELHTSGMYIPELREEIAHLGTLLQKQISCGVLEAYSKANGQETPSRFSSIKGDFKLTTFFWYKPVDSGSPPLGCTDVWKGKASLSGFESPFARARSPDKIDGNFYCLELHLLHFSVLPDDTITHHANSLLETHRLDNYEV